MLAGSLAAVEPTRAMHQHMQRADNLLTIGTASYDLHDYERIFVIGAGKAGRAMAHAAHTILGDYCTDMIVIYKDDGAPPPDIPHGMLLPARHPIPDERGVAATRRIVELVESARQRDLVLVLISGGGSALLTLPAPTLSLADIQMMTEQLLACGATINEINTLRKHLDLVKGGQLSRIAHPATVVTLILSDVIGNPLDVIASGPTVADPTTFADARAVLERYQLLDAVPPAILARLHAGERGEIPDTPTADDPAMARVHHVVIGSNEQAAMGAQTIAHAEGWNAHCTTLHECAPTLYQPERIGLGHGIGFAGEARLVGEHLATITRALATSPEALRSPLNLERPLCLIFGGETTVTLRGNGKGGRNQEMALAAVRGIAGVRDVVIVTLATDGQDGPTDAAGAVVTGDTLARAESLGLNPDMALAENDSYRFFAALDDLLMPDTTGTNVCDLAFIVVL